MLIRHLLPRLCYFAGLLMLLAGCGGSSVTLVPVTGTVYLDDQPLANAKIVFTPAEGRASFATTDAQGRYKLLYTADLAGAVTGKHRVTISTFIEPDPESSIEERKLGQVEKVPAKYNKKSTLEMEVSTADREPMDFKLSSKD